MITQPKMHPITALILKVSNWFSKNKRPKFEWKQDDGGKWAEGFGAENNDNSVYSLAIITGHSYKTTYLFLKGHGRVIDRSFKLINKGKDYTLLDRCFKWRETPFGPDETLESFCKRCGMGRYYIQTSRDYYACINRVIHSPIKPPPDTKISAIWKVESER